MNATIETVIGWIADEINNVQRSVDRKHGPGPLAKLDLASFDKGYLAGIKAAIETIKERAKE